MLTFECNLCPAVDHLLLLFNSCAVTSPFGIVQQNSRTTQKFHSTTWCQTQISFRSCHIWCQDLCHNLKIILRMPITFRWLPLYMIKLGKSATFRLFLLHIIKLCIPVALRLIPLWIIKLCVPAALKLFLLYTHTTSDKSWRIYIIYNLTIKVNVLANLNKKPKQIK